jgi:DNA polymerase elongation subunit (family B)
MLTQIGIDKILFLDIETVPCVYKFDDLDPKTQELYALKTRFIQEREERDAAEVYDRAGIYAEFGKVICISTAFINGNTLRVKSFYGEDEKEVLIQFADLLNRYFASDSQYLCGHNIKEFDIPFLARRMVINGVELPNMLDLAGKKPWEVRHLDTMELWKFGDYKHFTSLSLLTHIFGIPTPKDDISGADVSRVYWEEQDLERIKVYCEKDTIAVAQLLMKFKNLPLIKDEYIESV